MGYTHYWYRKQEEIPQGIWDQFTKKLTDVIERAGVKLERCDVDENEVWIEGGCESFVIPRTFTGRRTHDGEMFAFCKTARYPYDKIVVAGLILLATECKGSDVGFRWSSDGLQEDGERDDGLALTGLTKEEAVWPNDDD